MTAALCPAPPEQFAETRSDDHATGPAAQRWLARALGAARAWQGRRRTLQHLASLDAHLLEDIGADPEQIRRVLDRRWQPPWERLRERCPPG